MHGSYNRLLLLQLQQYIFLCGNSYGGGETGMGAEEGEGMEKREGQTHICFLQSRPYISSGMRTCHNIINKPILHDP